MKSDCCIRSEYNGRRLGFARAAAADSHSVMENTIKE